jgi:hypothetical protein
LTAPRRAGGTFKPLRRDEAPDPRDQSPRVAKYSDVDADRGLAFLIELVRNCSCLLRFELHDVRYRVLLCCAPKPL